MKDNQSLVSILVPIYGVEHFIERCARSLFEQTYKNIEYVFVNDCTKDHSVEVLLKTLDCYPERKNGFKLINHIKNSGIASTRNTLLSQCNGYFFMFVDSDDWLEKDAVEAFVNKQNEGDYDIVTCDYIVYEKSGPTYCPETYKVSPHEMLNDLLVGKTNGRLWGRLIKTSLIKNNDIAFIDGANFAEDVMFMSFLWFLCTSHFAINKSLYNYERRNISSYTNTFSYQNSIQSLKNLDGARLFFEKRAPQYLVLINTLEAVKVLGHMWLCCKDKSNREYFNSELIKRLKMLDKNTLRDVPWNSRIAFYIHDFDVLRFCVTIKETIKRIIKR